MRRNQEKTASTPTTPDWGLKGPAEAGKGCFPPPQELKKALRQVHSIFMIRSPILRFLRKTTFPSYFTNPLSEKLYSF